MVEAAVVIAVGRECGQWTKAMSAARQKAGEKVDDVKLKGRENKQKPAETTWKAITIGGAFKNNLFFSWVLSPPGYELDKTMALTPKEYSLKQTKSAAGSNFSLTAVVLSQLKRLLY